ncbi:choice-of-anchor D domain-containing protein [candidate division KSB1 bacterium]|nr:choice-of-anchor D domain-containing protein [candidate division KSB1 bacterium]
MKKILVFIVLLLPVVSYYSAVNTYAAEDSPPVGVIETPENNSNVRGTVQITGWAADDNSGLQIKIYRQDGASLVFIGDACFVEGIRPEIEQSYPKPQYYSGGWQFMLLTYFLPNQGNGAYTLHVVAHDAAGQQVILGTTNIICDNANSAKPFGMLDTPAPGGIINGTSFKNWGWALTPQPNSIPTDGSTIDVFVDSINIGHPLYNIYRTDIAAMFPGYDNSNGPVGYFHLNTLQYKDGLHTIYWSVTDYAGNTNTIGDRYFRIQNGPEIDIRGNNNSIASSDTIPSGVSNTDYGNVVTDGRMLTKTFAIFNTGASDLHLTGSPVATVNDENFKIKNQPPDVIAAFDTAFFDITFQPAATGLKTALVEIKSDDADESTYIFGVQGCGILNTDSLALVALYDSTNGENWKNNTNWLSGPVATWYGITASGYNVTAINLRDNNLSGYLPAEIGDLTQLTVLNLNMNQLKGEIPAELGNLVNLTNLNLGNNQLAGGFPLFVTDFVSLRELNLKNNQITGGIPAEIGNLSGLTELLLDGNELDGEIPIQLWTLMELQRLELDGNHLSGSLPTDIGNLIKLSFLELDGNEFTGSIPAEIGQLTGLYTLLLCRNRFSGSIPAEIGYLTNLQELELNNNILSGGVPAELINLTNLYELWIYNNQLTDLPGLSSLPALSDFWVQNNQFTFEDIEPNAGVPGIIYAPQDSVGSKQDTVLAAGTKITFSVAVGGSANVYQWMKDGIGLPDSDSSSLTIAAAAQSDAGDYICKITNPIAPALTLYSRPVHMTVIGETDIEKQAEQIPKEFALRQNYPNPFNPSTKILYEIPMTDYVSLKIYDILGREVATLISGKQAAGIFEIEWNAGDLPSGIYICRFESAEYSRSMKLVLQK